MRFLLLTILLFLAIALHGCARVSGDGQELAVKASNEAQTFVFECEDQFHFVARADDQSAWIFLPKATTKAQKVAVNLYRGDEVLFRLNGQDAMLEIPQGKYTRCSNDRRRAIWEHAKLNGADFRAVGNEPGWTLEIRSQSRIVLVTDYGAGRYDFNLPQPLIDVASATTVYDVAQDGETMVLTITAESCRDSMSGEQFESTVNIVMNERLLRGCGRALH